MKPEVQSGDSNRSPVTSVLSYRHQIFHTDIFSLKSILIYYLNPIVKWIQTHNYYYEKLQLQIQEKNSNLDRDSSLEPPDLSLESNAMQGVVACGTVII